MSQRSSDRVVLVVDDVPDLVELYAECLEPAGFRTLTATDAETALSLAAQTPHLSAVVTDLAMPRFDGCEVTRLLKAATATKDVPVVVVTGSSLAKHVEAAWAAGAAAVLSKPVEVKRLRLVVELAAQKWPIPRHLSVTPF